MRKSLRHGAWTIRLTGMAIQAFAALYKVKRAKAQELQIEGYKIAQHRSLCEVVRQLPVDRESLSACWGFGGSGVRLKKYGDMFLAALAPHAERVRAAAHLATLRNQQLGTTFRST